MTTLAIDMRLVSAQKVKVTNDAIIVDLKDGRTISVPLAWYPRLLHGSPQERSNWQLIGTGEGIHWPDLDEDLSVEGIILGKPSEESQISFKRWLKAHQDPSTQPKHQIAEKKAKYRKKSENGMKQS